MNEKPPFFPSIATQAHEALVSDIIQLIHQAQRRVATEINSTVVLLYWTIGKRINDAILEDQRADYGSQVIENVSAKLSLHFGQGYSRSALFRMVRFSKFYPDAQIVATVSRQLSWSHIILLCQMDEELKRDFYLQMACIEKWSVRTLREKMNSMLFERTALSKHPEEVIKYELQKLAETQQLTPHLVFRDPCFLDFIGLNTKYSESDLENAILNHIEEFIQELGSDFCFVARQKECRPRRKTGI